MVVNQGLPDTYGTFLAGQLKTTSKHLRVFPRIITLIPLWGTEGDGTTNCDQRPLKTKGNHDPYPRNPATHEHRKRRHQYNISYMQDHEHQRASDDEAPHEWSLSEINWPLV